MFPPRRNRRGPRDPAIEAAPSATQQDSGQVPLAGFTTLPTELQREIIELACTANVEKSDDNDEALDEEEVIEEADPMDAVWQNLVAQGLPQESVPHRFVPIQRPPARIQGISPSLDIPTILSLCLVSRQLYQSLIGTVYANVCIARPSALLQLSQTLASRPALGRLIRSMHLGPLEPVRNGHEKPTTHGARRQGPSDVLKCGLEDEALLPIWYKPGRHWVMQDGMSPRNCQEAAVYAAIPSAAYALNLNPCDQYTDLKGVYIGVNAYTTKAYMLQAALDLYLMEMRRIEQRDGLLVKPWSEEPTTAAGQTQERLHTGKCRSYPPLVVKTPWTASTAAGDADRTNAFVITLAQINQYLARPGSNFDRFDHPLLFYRSGVQGFFDDGPGRGETVGSEDPYELAHPEDGRPLFKDSSIDGDSADVWNVEGLKRNDEWDDIVWPQELRNDLDPSFPAASTLGSLLTSARAILCATPSVVHLSMSGFLQRALCGSRCPPGLKALKELSLGPAPPFWYAPMRLDHAAIASVEKLRIVGVWLFKSEIAAIAGRGNALPNLRELEWTMTSEHDWEHIDLLESVKRLLRRPLTVEIPAQPRSEIGTDDGHAPGGNEENPGEDDLVDGDDAISNGSTGGVAPAEAGSTDAASSFISTSAQPRPGSVRFEVRLCASDKEALIASAPSPEARHAWVHGLPCPHHRLILVEGRAAEAPRTESERYWGCAPLAWFILHDEGREWWEERATAKWQWS